MGGYQDFDTISLNSQNGQKEKILVSVRLRPLSDKERLRNEVSDWECINNTTVIFKSSIPERAMFPSAYTFGNWIPGPQFSCLSNAVYLQLWVGMIGFSYFSFWFNCRGQIGSLDAIAQQSRSTRKEPKKLRLQWSAESTVSIFISSHPQKLLADLLHFGSYWLSVSCLLYIASIFAYGQTSSGKTFTMGGITEYAVSDIYEYIEKVIPWLARDLSSIFRSIGY